MRRGTRATPETQPRDNDELYLGPNTVREMLSRYGIDRSGGWVVETADGSLAPYNAPPAETDELKRQLASIAIQWQTEGYDPTAGLQ